MNERNKQLEAVLVAAKEWQNTITDVPTTIEAIDVDTALCDAIAAALNTTDKAYDEPLTPEECDKCAHQQDQYDERARRR